VEVYCIPSVSLSSLYLPSDGHRALLPAELSVIHIYTRDLKVEQQVKQENNNDSRLLIWLMF